MEACYLIRVFIGSPWLLREELTGVGGGAGVKVRAGTLGWRSLVQLGGCVTVVGALEEGEMVGMRIQFEDQADEICCWVSVEEGKRKELKMTPAFSLIIWTDRANRERLGSQRGLVLGPVMSEVPERSLHGDIEKTVGSMGLETGGLLCGHLNTEVISR